MIPLHVRYGLSSKEGSSPRLAIATMNGNTNAGQLLRASMIMGLEISGLLNYLMYSHGIGQPGRYTGIVSVMADLNSSCS